ncbi:MAG TPA: hypothetical protein VLZ06_05535 [Solirubrobacteraceae bacterium]|nr:hypothetical protein [Solirubrobacteraceae bacterium]
MLHRNRPATHSLGTAHNLTRGRQAPTCDAAGGLAEGTRVAPMRTGRIVPPDPYAAWLRKRESEREAERLKDQLARNPGAAWDAMRGWVPPHETRIFGAVRNELRRATL